MDIARNSSGSGSDNGNGKGVMGFYEPWNVPPIMKQTSLSSFFQKKLSSKPVVKPCVNETIGKSTNDISIASPQKSVISDKRNWRAAFHGTSSSSTCITIDLVDEPPKNAFDLMKNAKYNEERKCTGSFFCHSKELSPLWPSFAENYELIIGANIPSIPFSIPLSKQIVEMNYLPRLVRRHSARKIKSRIAPYCPSISLEHLKGPNVKFIQNWLASWNRSDVDEEFLSDIDDQLLEQRYKLENKALLIVGNDDAAMASAIYLAATALEYHVIEINPSMNRSSKSVKQFVESTQSQRISSSFFSENWKSSNNAKSLIFLEAVDCVYEDDKFFWTAISDLVKQAKRPVILSSRTSMHILSCVPQFPDFLKLYTWRSPSPDVVTSKLFQELNAFGIEYDEQYLKELVRHFRSNTSGIVNWLKFWGPPVDEPFRLMNNFWSECDDRHKKWPEEHFKFIDDIPEASLIDISLANVNRWVDICSEIDAFVCKSKDYLDLSVSSMTDHNSTDMCIYPKYLFVHDVYDCSLELQEFLLAFSDFSLARLTDHQFDHSSALYNDPLYSSYNEVYWICDKLKENDHDYSTTDFASDIAPLVCQIARDCLMIQTAKRARRFVSYFPQLDREQMIALSDYLLDK